MSSYQICTRCIMDSSAPNIQFDTNGLCNFCTKFYASKNKTRGIPKAEREPRLKALVEDIKAHPGKKYDCLLGVSGGIDSTYALHLIKELGLNPLAVHLDNGWNSEAATNNIHSTLKALGVELLTHVIDWEVFRDLQRAFFAADVVDIELLTDHAILASLYQTAHKYGIKYILTGMNNSTEGMSMPKGWNHFKFDARNIKAIHKQFGENPSLKTFPLMPLFQYCYFRYVRKITIVDFLDYFDYNKDQATQLLVDKYGFKPYVNKHYENIFTRFNQAIILPKKFGIDKRRLHYSNLICTQQMTRDEALQKIAKSSYPTESMQNEDRQYVLKKLNFSNQEFENYLQRPSRAHLSYPSDYPLYRKLRRWLYKY